MEFGNKGKNIIRFRLIVVELLSLQCILSDSLKSVTNSFSRVCAAAYHIVAGILSALLLWGCSSVKHVPEGKYLLDDVKINITDSAGIVESSQLVNYLRQSPNHKILGFLKLQLATYNMSGKDTTKWYNRWVRRLGQAPVIYDSELTSASAKQLRMAMVNRGFMDATVSVDTIADTTHRKMHVAYNIASGSPRVISSITYEIPDSAIAPLVLADSALFTLKPGDIFDRNRLDNERTLISDRLRNNGYYSFSKEYITFFADTANNSMAVELTMSIRPPRPTESLLPDTTLIHPVYKVRKVVFVTDAGNNGTLQDTVIYRDIEVVYGSDRYIKPGVLEEKCFIHPGKLYKAKEVDRTYEALSQLGILRTINIEMLPVRDGDGNGWLDAYILLTRNKKQGISLELEGTNSEGDLGFGVGVSYTHRNLGKRSELLNAKFRINYESLSGNLSGLINNRYTEFAAETGITFPKFLFPFLSRSYKQRVKAATELALSFNYQERPEYTRIIAGAAWKYKWTARQNRERRTFDLLDINYVYLPESTIDFINQIAPTNPLLRYSYEDHFIMRSGYTFYRTNRRITSATEKKVTSQPFIYTLRVNGEIAGNLLYAISSLTGQKRRDGVYKLFGIQYSQYAKAEIDYSLTKMLAYRHTLAFRAGFGIGVPYGNSHILPFEKRFYAGGANGVRGWAVRTLGPGRYDAKNNVSDFINQCGDISFITSIEYRMKLFWVFEGAIFADAGNIWTIHDYENQPGGLFRFDTFWKQIAASYGAGLRLDFTYFLLRFDLGLKAHNPAMHQEQWPIIHPRWRRDATFHFSVGYPF
ncbi:MAG: BamA/TamA family outer membrane protein [Paramuribaculum sp.]|nr:BamA/TamA family outer membrane protein [Paramuribaculum sp.]